MIPKRILPLLALVALLAVPSSTAAAPAGSTFLVSRPDGTGPLVAPSDNDSTGPLAVSADGRYVAFPSEADGFATGADPRVLNLFVRDTVTNTTTLASRSDGVNGAGVNADVEAVDGAKIGIVVQPGSQVMDAPHDRPHVLVVFSTKATNLVDHVNRAVPPTGGREEVWMRDITAGTTYLVSRESTLTGAPADGRSSQPSIAAGPGGPLVAFVSASTNLDRAGQTSLRRSVYLREMAEGVTQVVSCNLFRCGPSQGTSVEPSLRFVDSVGAQGSELCPTGELCAMVAFRTSDEKLGGPGTSDANTQIVVSRALEKLDGSGLADFDLWRVGSTEWLHPATLGNRSSWEPSLSPDGLGVAFLSEATNLDPFGPPLPPQPVEGYVHTFGSNATGLATVGKNGSGVSIAANAPVMQLSLGGSVQSWRFGFSTRATNLGVPDNPNGLVRAYQVLPVAEPASLLDRGAGNAGVIGSGGSAEVALSPDGSTAVFASTSGNLNAGGGADFARVYRRGIDPRAPGFGSLQLVSRPGGTAAFSPGSKRTSIRNSAVSADGRYVAFEANADELASADDDRFVNVFVRDTVNATTTLVSRANGAGGAAADATSELDGISENGQRILFSTSAGNLGAGQPGEHAYVRDLAAQTTTIVTRANGPTGAIAGGVGMSISGDGNRVAFGAAVPLDPAATAGLHLYVRDLAAQTTTLADRNDGRTGFAAELGPEDASLDRDGSRVAWSTRASIPVPGVEAGHLRRVFVRDLATGTTSLASRADGANGVEANGDSLAPAIDAAGDVVAFESDATNLGLVADRSIWIRRFATGRTELVSRANGATGDPANDFSYAPSIDASGNRVAFVSHAGNFGPVPNEEGPDTEQAYVRDTAAKTTELVSRVNGLAGAPADPSGVRGVSISASGDCVAFAGFGANYTDDLASADFAAVRERVLRGSCGPSSVPAAGVAAPGAALPVLSRLQMRPARFYVGPGGGTRISFDLSEASRVVLAFDRIVAHRGAGKLALRRVGRLVVQGRPGANAVRFSGRLRGRPLLPGRYRWTATASQGHPASGRFAVVRRPRS